MRCHRQIGIGAVVLMLALSGCGDGKKVESEMSYRELGIQYLEEGNYTNAISAFDEALALRPKKRTNLEQDIYFYKAKAWQESGELDKAVETYTTLLEDFDETADAYYLRGCAYLALEASGEAKADFKMAEKLLQKELEQGDTAANLGLGLIYESLEEPEKALELFLAYREAYPYDARVYEELGQLELELLDYDAAYEFYTQGLACEQVDNRQALWSGKIAAMEYRGDFTGARQEMEQYLNSYPGDAHAQREYLFLKTR